MFIGEEPPGGVEYSPRERGPGVPQCHPYLYLKKTIVLVPMQSGRYLAYLADLVLYVSIIL